MPSIQKDKETRTPSIFLRAFIGTKGNPLAATSSEKFPSYLCLGILCTRSTGCSCAISRVCPQPGTWSLALPCWGTRPGLLEGPGAHVGQQHSATHTSCAGQHTAQCSGRLQALQLSPMESSAIKIRQMKEDFLSPN